MTSSRCIMHVDMDAFYAAVEQVDNPPLKGKPVIVGASRRGVVTAASYEARPFGVRSAMPVFKARKLCPHGVFLPVRMERYREVSRQVMAILSNYSPLVEVVSIDEATLDLTGTQALHGSPMKVAVQIKEEILARTGCTCSVGIAPNKLLAKIASDWEKPDGMTVIREEEVASFLANLPVSKMPGIGRNTQRLLKELGVAMVGDVLRFPEIFWIDRLGVNGVRLYEKAQGTDRSPVIPERKPKSCSSENTFPENLLHLEELDRWILRHAEKISGDLRRRCCRGGTVSVKVKFADFRVMTKSCTLHEPTDCSQVVYDTANTLLRSIGLRQPVRLIGVGVSNLTYGMLQGRLFDRGGLCRLENLDRAMDEIREKFGKRGIVRGRLFSP